MLNNEITSKKLWQYYLNELRTFPSKDLTIQSYYNILWQNSTCSSSFELQQLSFFTFTWMLDTTSLWGVGFHGNPKACLLGNVNPILRTPVRCDHVEMHPTIHKRPSLSRFGWPTLHYITLLTTRSAKPCLDFIWEGVCVFDLYRWKWCNYMVSFFWQSLGSSVDCDKCGKLSFNGLSPAF